MQCPYHITQCKPRHLVADILLQTFLLRPTSQFLASKLVESDLMEFSSASKLAPCSKANEVLLVFQVGVTLLGFTMFRWTRIRGICLFPQSESSWKILREILKNSSQTLQESSGSLEEFLRIFQKFSFRTILRWRNRQLPN